MKKFVKKKIKIKQKQNYKRFLVFSIQLNVKKKKIAKKL